MDPQKKKLLLLAGIGLVVLYVYTKSKGTSTSPRAQAATDPLQAAAQQLGLQRQQQQAQLAASADQVAQNEANTLSQFSFFKTLAADPAYACPNGGRPRWIPGQGPGCIGPRTGAITLGSLVNDALGAFKVYSGVSGGGGGGGVYPYSEGDVPAGPSKTPYGPGLPYDYGKNGFAGF